MSNRYLEMEMSFTSILISINSFVIVWVSRYKVFPGDASDEEPSWQCRRWRDEGSIPRVGKILWRGAWQPTPVFLSGESHRQRTQSRVPKSCTWLKWLSTSHALEMQPGISLTSKILFCGCWIQNITYK